MISTMHDPYIPDPRDIATYLVESVRDGDWDDPGTWSGGQVPDPADTVEVYHHVSVRSGTCLDCVVSAGGRLELLDGVDLWVRTLMVLGHLQGGSGAAPISGRITIRDMPLDLTHDPGQYLHGLLVLDGGSCHLEGHWVKPYHRSQMLSGSSQIVDLPSSWGVGDRVWLPDTRRVALRDVTPEWEYRTIESVITATDGTVEGVLDSPLVHDHVGRGQQCVPHVVNLSRSLVIQSERPDGVRGHVLLQGDGYCELRSVAIRDMGRTLNTYDTDSTTWDASGNVTHLGSNQIARYPLHLHHLIGPPHGSGKARQFILDDVVVDGGEGPPVDQHWGVVVHGSHYGMVKDVVTHNTAGWSFVCEDGSETGNLFQGCAATRVWSDGKHWRFSGDEWTPTGREAVGFAGRGARNLYIGCWASNVAADNAETAYGFKFLQTRLTSVMVPNRQGDNPHMPGQGYSVNPQAEFALDLYDCEVYASDSGLTYWYVGVNEAGTYHDTVPESRIVRLRCWALPERCVFHYPAQQVRVTDPHWLDVRDGWYPGDYEVHAVTITGGLIQADTGIHGPSRCVGEMLVDNVTLACSVVDVRVVPHFQNNDNTDANTTPKSLRIRDCQFIGHATHVSFVGVPNSPWGYNGNFRQANEVWLEGYQGADWRVYSLLQAPDVVMATTVGRMTVWAPDGTSGLTNAEGLAQYGICTYGEITPPGATTLPHVFGEVVVQVAPPATTGTKRETASAGDAASASVIGGPATASGDVSDSAVVGDTALAVVRSPAGVTEAWVRGIIDQRLRELLAILNQELGG